MATKEEVLQEFKALNFTPNDKSLEKCVQMCQSYNLTAEEIVDQWSAYSLTNLKGEDPTLEYLEKMERKEFQKASKDTPAKRNLNDEIYHQPQVNSLGTPKYCCQAELYINPKNPLKFAALATKYRPGFPGLKIAGLFKEQNHAPVSRIQTPVQSKRIADDSAISSPGSESGNYSSRSDARSVRCTYGPASQFKKDKNVDLKIASAQELCMSQETRYSYEVLRKKRLVLNETTEYLARLIVDDNSLTVHEDYLRRQINREVTTYGRIISDCGGKLNSQSVLLEGTRHTNQGHTTLLNLTKLSRYSLFPGQIAAIKGTYHQGNKMVVDEIFTGTELLLPEEPPLTQDSLQMVIACGPFTTKDNLTFEPLTDLLAYVNEHRPHILMLLGPFYERNNDGIMNGELNQTFDELFHQLIDTIMETVNGDTHVIVVSSQREPHYHPVYPTMPYAVIRERPNLTLLPDPCLVNINGLLLGATTADVMFHISNFEIHQDRNSTADRLGRIASHLFNQHSFYPLDPPFNDMCVDHKLMEKYGVLDDKPHVMVLPSNFRHFVKNVENCLVINPERLTKGVGGGTFAHLEIQPGYTQSVCERSSCQVLKI